MIRPGEPAQADDVREGKPAPKPVTCSFCEKTSLERKRVLAGKSAFLCDECAVRTLSTLALPFGGSPAPAPYFVEAICFHLEALEAGPTWDRYADAAIVLAGDDADALQRIFRVSVKGMHPSHTVAIAGRLPADALGSWARIGLAVAHFHLAEHARALEILESIEDAKPEHRPRIDLDSIGNRLRLPEPLSREELEATIVRLDELAAAVPAALARAVLSHRAECQLRLGDARGAKETLARIPEALGPLQQLILGDACAALGDREGARAAYEAGAAAAERVAAAELAERLRALGAW